LQNLHQLFDWQYIGQIIGGNFAKFCGLLRIFELYYIAHRPTTTMLWLHYAPSTTLSHREIVVTVGILVIL
jgi:hypothetical protein